MATENTAIFGGESIADKGSSPSSEQAPVYHGAYESKGQKYTLYGFISVIVLMVVIAFILCIKQGVSSTQGFLFFLLALNLVGFIFIEIMILRMIRSGDLAKEKAWFLYFLGACTIAEALFVDIVVMN